MYTRSRTLAFPAPASRRLLAAARPPAHRRGQPVPAAGRLPSPHRAPRAVPQTRTSDQLAFSGHSCTPEGTHKPLTYAPALRTQKSKASSEFPWQTPFFRDPFGFLAGSPIVGLQPLRSPWVKPDTGFIHGGYRDRTEGQAASHWWVAILISKGTYLQGSSWAVAGEGDPTPVCQTVRSLYGEAWVGLGHVYHPDALNNTLLSQSYSAWK